MLSKKDILIYITMNIVAVGILLIASYLSTLVNSERMEVSITICGICLSIGILLGTPFFYIAGRDWIRNKKSKNNKNT